MSQKIFMFQGPRLMSTTLDGVADKLIFTMWLFENPKTGPIFFKFKFAVVGDIAHVLSCS